MANIGLIDDRIDIRTTLERKVGLSLKRQKSTWGIIAIDPFPNMSDYIAWIKENDIGILIIDERLQEGNHEAINVSYNGSNLIDFIRKSLQDFPVFAITSYPNDQDLQSKFPLFDEILSRDNFFKKSDEYTQRFVRAGQRFLDVYNTQLLRISEISNLIAIGKANESMINELHQLQTYLNIPFTAYEFLNRESWLEEYGSKLDELEEISNRIKLFIQKKDHK